MLPERIESLIYFAHGQKVMFDDDLAKLYGVTTKALTRAVRRNIDRFPSDFMFQLSLHEVELLRCQIGTSKVGRGGRRHPPMLFTEQGIAMLSSVLRSKRAIQVNIEIMRAFVKLRLLVSSHTELAEKLAKLEHRYDMQFKVVFDAIREIMQPKTPFPSEAEQSLELIVIMAEAAILCCGFSRHKRLERFEVFGFRPSSYARR